MEKGGDAEKKQKIFTNYISQPQIWNKYVYSINNPINYSDPDGRRPLTQAEQDQLKQFRELGYAYSVERMNSDDPNLRWTAAQAEAFRHRVDAASQVIENAILAVPDKQEDPRNLRVVLYAMSKFGNPQFTNSGDVYFNSNGAKVSLGNGQNKCTIFIGIAYAKGGGIGWKAGKNAGGYQVDWWNRTWEYRVPVANAIADNGLANFSATSSPTMGDVVIGKGVGGAGGHGGIYINSDVVISANQTHGVRTGSFASDTTPNGGFRYFTYKP
mgnify:CR=1 FL=1